MASADRVERVARAMCAAEGNDPDLKVYGLQAEFIEPEHEGSGIATQFHGSQWRKYGKRALIFIAAFDALQAS